MANLTNKQQSEVLEFQANNQRLFTQAASDNAALQFNATSANQVNQFYETLGATVEKQNAESGGMPVVSNEAEVYGYSAENRHMVESFLNGKRPDENFDDGLEVTRLLMAAYMSAEQEKTIKLPNDNIETFIPAVAEGKWNPKG